MESIGIRELRQHASRIIKSAEDGAEYRVTNHGQDTGVTISRRHVPAANVSSRQASGGASPDRVQVSGVYDQQRPVDYENLMLALVERGRDASGTVDTGR